MFYKPSKVSDTLKPQTVKVEDIRLPGCLELIKFVRQVLAIVYVYNLIKFKRAHCTTGKDLTLHIECDIKIYVSFVQQVDF